MIHIFFVPGMFGSTVEYVLRSCTNEFSPIVGEVLADGSMHSYKKEFHLNSIELIQTFNNYNANANSITTPNYPLTDAKLPYILELYQPLLVDSQSILIYSDSTRAAELNMLFRYHKIATGSLNSGLEIFCGENSHNVVNWNSSYTSWKDMQKWELREWLSLFYVPWVQEWITSQDQVPNNFLKIKTTDILFKTKETLLNIIKFCNLTPKSNLDSFIIEWQQKQNYIVNEFNLLDQIVNCTIKKSEFRWTNLNIIAESIIQQRLRANGFEIKCNDLNVFPTDSISLYNLLERC